MMKIIDRYIVFSILKTAIVAIIVLSLILSAVELFGKMDSIINGSISLGKVFVYALYSIPQHLMMVSAIAFLFATTYFMSMLSSNNERIAILNTGYGKGRIALPIIILSIVVTLISIVAKENILNPLTARYEAMGQELFGRSGSSDVRNIVLKDRNGHIIYTSRYIPQENRILLPVVVKTEDGVITERIEGKEGYWDNGWTIYDAKCYFLSSSGVETKSVDSIYMADLEIDPAFFQSENLSVETMEVKMAAEYLSKLKTTSPPAWQEKCTDYLRSFFSPLSIFVLTTVAATMSYSMKKNVLLFSIIQALCLAVVYFVADMVFSIAAHQGAFHPMLSVLLPVALTIGVNVILDRLGKMI